jgi:hypothetical protein
VRRHEGESGRAVGGDSDIQRGRPNPDGRLFRQATTRTLPRAYATHHTCRSRSGASARPGRQPAADPNGQTSPSYRLDQHFSHHLSPSEEEIFVQGLTERGARSARSRSVRQISVSSEVPPKPEARFSPYNCGGGGPNVHVAANSP